MNLKYTGERLVTTVFNDNTISHLHRYAMALTLVKGKKVLDIASGEGYGSNLLSSEADYVYGVDIDEETIKNASNKYKKDNLQFLQGSTSNIPILDNSIDVVISFETLEHHDEHDEMMEEVKRVLRPHGILLISTPDRYFYSELKNYNNQFHVKELYEKEFTDLIARYFKSQILYSQRYINGSSVILEKTNSVKFDFYTGDFSNLKLISPSPDYLIAICSDDEIHIINDSIFEGKHILDNEILNKRLKYVYESNTYKVGRFMLSPYRYFKRILG